MSTEVIVLRAFMGDQAVAEEMLAHGFGPDLMTTREGRTVAERLLEFRKMGRIPIWRTFGKRLSGEGNSAGDSSGIWWGWSGRRVAPDSMRWHTSR